MRGSSGNTLVMMPKDEGLWWEAVCAESGDEAVGGYMLVEKSMILSALVSLDQVHLRGW